MFILVVVNLVAIMGGILVFCDLIGIGVLVIVGRVIVFGFVIVGVVMMSVLL